MTPVYDESNNLNVEKSMQGVKMGDTLLTVMPILIAMVLVFEKLRTVVGRVQK